MARIPDEELERIKREVSVAELARERGIELKAHGGNLIGLCPFHDDREPSFVVTPSKNLWHCLGACQSGGTSIDFVMRNLGISFRHAVEILRSGNPSLAASASGPAPKRSLVPKLPVFAPGNGDSELMKEVVRFYHEALKESPEALAYLESRGLRSSEMVERFQIGFANRTLGYRLPGKHLRTGPGLRSRLQGLGVLRESGHEHFVGSVVFPILDEHGEVRGIYGRKIRDDLRAGTPVHMYLPGPHRGVWNIAALSATKELILCESIIDALTFWCAGFRNVTAAYGVEGFTDELYTAIRKHGICRLLIAYDRDEAGNRAAEKLAKWLVPLGIECLRVNFPHQMDANAYALKVTPAERSLAVLLNAAEWMGGSAGARLLAGSASPKSDAAVVKPAPITTPAPAVAVTETVNPVVAVEKAAVESALSVQSEPKPLSTTPPTVALCEPVSPLAAASTPAAPPAVPSPPLRLIETPLVEPPAQSVAAPSAASDLAVDERPDGLLITLGDRVYRVRGLEKNTAYEKLAVNLRVGRAEAYHQDNVDLADAKKRAKYIECAAVEIAVKEDVVKRDLGKILLKLEELQDALIRKTLAPKEKTVHLTEAEQAAALELLKDPSLLERILSDFERCGVVGERTNKLVGYLAAVSRLLEKPLGVMIQSSSAAGKTALMDAVLGFVPCEQQVKYSAMTGQSLFYMGEQDLRHKILAVAEEEGASRATYALKLLQSEGELSIASTGKDPQSGKLVTHEYRVTGPVMTIFSTTAVDLDEELTNRCLTLAIDESREQTRAIHRQQRSERTREGIWAREDRSEVRTQHQNAQRLLKPLPVLNPYAEKLRFLDNQTRSRRDQPKYLALIDTITLLHQYQRPGETLRRGAREKQCVVTTAADVRLANELAAEVLGRTLDELGPQSRRLLLEIHQMVGADCQRLSMARADFRFSRKEVRRHTGWSDFQVKAHMRKLEELEYVLAHRGSRGQSFVYELLYDGEGQDGSRFVMGLIDPDRSDYDEKKEHGFAEKEHQKGDKEHSSSPQGAWKEGTRSIAQNPLSAFSANASGDPAAERAGNAYKREEKPPRSYVAGGRTPEPPARMPDALASLAAAVDSLFDADDDGASDTAGKLAAKLGVTATVANGHSVPEVVARTANGNGLVASNGTGL